MKFKKKPVVIEAVQWSGNNMDEVLKLDKQRGIMYYDEISKVLEMETLEGTMTASVGDWIIQGVQGEIYPCKPDIFKETYELVEEN